MSSERTILSVDKDRLLESIATIRRSCELAKQERDLAHMRMGIDVALKNIDRLTTAVALLELATAWEDADGT